MSVAESVDDRGEEVLEGLRQKGCMLEQDEEIDAIISDSKFQSRKEGHAGSVISLHGIVERQHSANDLPSSVSHLELAGKFGKMNL